MKERGVEDVRFVKLTNGVYGREEGRKMLSVMFEMWKVRRCLEVLRRKKENEMGRIIALGVEDEGEKVKRKHRKKDERMKMVELYRKCKDQEERARFMREKGVKKVQ